MDRTLGTTRDGGKPFCKSMCRARSQGKGTRRSQCKQSNRYRDLLLLSAMQRPQTRESIAGGITLLRQEYTDTRAMVQEVLRRMGSSGGGSHYVSSLRNRKPSPPSAETSETSKSDKARQDPITPHTLHILQSAMPHPTSISNILDF